MALQAAEPDGDSVNGFATPQGDVIAFSSGATDLIQGDTNGTTDVFVLDLTTGVIERISVDSKGNEADGDSGPLGISADGDCVLFRSNATNLVAKDVNSNQDVFVHDRAAGTTTCVSVNPHDLPADYRSFSGSMSVDERYVAFDSESHDLVSGDDNHCSDVFLRGLTNGTAIRVSENAGGSELNLKSHGASLASDTVLGCDRWSSPKSRRPRQSR